MKVHRHQNRHPSNLERRHYRSQMEIVLLPRNNRGSILVQHRLDCCYRHPNLLHLERRHYRYPHRNNSVSGVLGKECHGPKLADRSHCHQYQHHYRRHHYPHSFPRQRTAAGRWMLNHYFDWRHYLSHHQNQFQRNPTVHRCHHLHRPNHRRHRSPHRYQWYCW